MTTTELLKSLVANTVVTAEMEEKAKAMLNAEAEANARRKAKDSSKRATENAPLIEACTSLLMDGASRTASEIATALNINTSKATVIAKAVENVVIGSTKLKGRSVKTYSLNLD